VVARINSRVTQVGQILNQLPQLFDTRRTVHAEISLIRYWETEFLRAEIKCVHDEASGGPVLKPNISRDWPTEYRAERPRSANDAEPAQESWSFGRTTSESSVSQTGQ
jgi:hypothetical protein